jgi:hypothetical protein
VLRGAEIAMARGEAPREDVGNAMLFSAKLLLAAATNGSPVKVTLPMLMVAPTETSPDVLR